jgi:hypothetical protein
MLGCFLFKALAAAPIPPRRAISWKTLNRFQSTLRANVTLGSEITFDLPIAACSDGKDRNNQLMIQDLGSKNHA